VTRIKGQAIRGVLKSVKESGWSIPELIQALPEAEREVYARPIVVSTWYPYSAFAALIRAADRVHGSGNLQLCFDLGRRGGQRDMGTTFRIITAISSVDFVLKQSVLFWGKYCDKGRMILEREAPMSCVGRMEDFPDIDNGHCEMIAGWLEGVGSGLGAIGLRCRQVLCVHRGDPHCGYDCRWAGVRGPLS
jgi:predicted hydrocarbon binding protein